MFKKQSKKFISAMLVLVFVASMMTNSICATNNGELTTTSSVVQPRWSNLVSYTMGIDLDGPIIQVSATLMGRTDTTYTNGTLVLEKISGSNCGVVQTWYNISSNSRILQFGDSSEKTTPGTYVLTLTIDAVRYGVSETISVSQEANC